MILNKEKYNRCDVKEKLKATITQMGTPTIFWTLSMAGFHWPDIHDLFFIEHDPTNFRLLTTLIL